MMRAILVLLIIFALPRLAAADPVQALPPDVVAAAKRHYESGADFYERGKLAEAHEEFLAAYRLSNLPDLLYNLGRVAEKRGLAAEAAAYYERFLHESPKAPDRARIETDIQRLRSEAEPAPAPLLDLTSQMPPPPPPKPRRLPPWPALGLLGGGATLMVIGFGLGGGALSAARQLESMDRFDEALYSRGQSMNQGAIALDVMGGLALVGGATWTLVWYFKTRRP
jgi:tetratricopeptide (TPR) repeat protein